MRRPRFRIRTLMIAPAAAALALRLVIHIPDVVRAEDDFAVPILMLEGIAGLMLLAIGLAVGGVARFVREDNAYAARLRARDAPDQCPFPLSETIPPGRG